VLHVLLALMLFAGVSSAAAAPASDRQVVNETVSFSIPAGQCPALPAGLSVSGTGQRHMIINTHTKANGTTEIRVNDVITGVATDSNGGVHNFVYRNSSTETIPPSGDHTVSMKDIFILNGPGPRYSVGFNWRWTYNPDIEPLWPPVHNWEQISTRGDIFGCDPL
jgi:hypothetical protein